MLSLSRVIVVLLCAALINHAAESQQPARQETKRRDKTVKLETVPNDPSSVKLNGRTITKGITFLEMLNAVGVPPEHISFDKCTFSANYSVDIGGLTLMFGNDGKLLLTLLFRY